MISKVLTLEQIGDVYHILSAYDEVGNSLQCLADSYLLKCQSKSGRVCKFVYCGCDFFGDRLYSLEDESYKEGFIYG